MGAHFTGKRLPWQQRCFWGWEFTDRFSVIDFMKKMVYPTNNAKLKLGG